MMQYIGVTVTAQGGAARQIACELTNLNQV